MPPARFAEASTAHLDRLTRPLIAARVFPDEATLYAVHRARPWAIQVNSRGDVAVLDTWRDHLRLLAIEALWCPHRLVPDAVSHVNGIALEHGFTGIVSPPVAEADVAVWRGAGLAVREVLETLELRLAGLAHEGAPDGVRAADPRDQDVTIRTVGPEGVPAVLEVDAHCFESFWRYDRRLMDRFAAEGGLAVAERAGRCLGYPLCTVDRGSAVLGRLCVDVPHRRHGVGMALLRAAVLRAREAGADRMALSTQSGNAGALALYRACGFRLSGRRYAFLTLGDDGQGGEGHSIGQIMGD